MQPSLASVDWSSLPVPQDDGAARHLAGLRLPDVALIATDGREIRLAALSGTAVLFCCPMTGTPGVALPDGWDEIPGARGCTPQSCTFRDLFAELSAAGADHVFGVSTQSPDEQREAASRLHLPFPLLSDAKGALSRAMSLPVMTVDGRVMIKRLTMIVRAGTIAHMFYPVFPPDRNAADVLAWLRGA